LEPAPTVYPEEEAVYPREEEAAPRSPQEDFLAQGFALPNELIELALLSEDESILLGGGRRPLPPHARLQHPLLRRTSATSHQKRTITLFSQTSICLERVTNFVTLPRGFQQGPKMGKKFTSGGWWWS
jgi:hypothetical protein